MLTYVEKQEKLSPDVEKLSPDVEKLSPDVENKQNCHLTLENKANCHLTLGKLSPDVGKNCHLTILEIVHFRDSAF